MRHLLAAAATALFLLPAVALAQDTSLIGELEGVEILTDFVPARELHPNSADL